MTTWRLLIDNAADGATNMACDEALLAAVAAGDSPPVLRLYRWQPACLSLGRFQRSAEVAFDGCAARGVAVVRRPSGGRALLHADELTYALVARTDHPLFHSGDSILDTYQQISAALLVGLCALGIAAELAPVARRRGGSAACYDVAASYEVTVEGRKLIGSAQARRDGALLQHGAIPLASSAGQLAACLRTSPPDLADRIVTLDAALGRVVEWEDVARALVAGFEAAWGIRFQRDDWTPAEQVLVAELRETRYLKPEWTRGR